MCKKLKVLALEPFYGGSHKAFLDTYITSSAHEWTVMSLPDTFWKWRMRHSAVHFADELSKAEFRDRNFDIVFCSDMMNLAEFRALAQSCITLPSVLYFHENQLSYPVPGRTTPDSSSVMTNIVSALAASEVWFNSAFHMNSFLEALPAFMERRPDFAPCEAIEKIRLKSRVFYPGIENIGEVFDKGPGPVRILWAARWEHDKNPADFFRALRKVRDSGCDFRLSIVGERTSRVPSDFKRAKKEFAPFIENWGYVQSRREYLEILKKSHIAVSTAIHEFFGISMLEAAASGAHMLLPERLSYPEIFSNTAGCPIGNFFYDGSSDDLARKLTALIRAEEPLCSASKPASRYFIGKLAPEMDSALLRIAAKY